MSSQPSAILPPPAPLSEACMALAHRTAEMISGIRDEPAQVDLDAVAQPIV